MLNIEYLSHFLTAADYLNFTLAADRLFLNQSTLSRQMTALEEECGVSLFVRNGRTVQLTDAGHILYREGRPLLDDINRIMNLVADTGQSANARVTVYTVPAIYDSFDAIFARMANRRPNISVHVKHLQSEDILALLKKGTADFAILYESFLPAETNIYSIPLEEEGFSLICPHDHPLATRESVTLDECLREKVLFGDDFPRALRDGVRTLQLASGAKLTNNMETLRCQVLNMGGVMILPTGAARDFSSSCARVPIVDADLRHRIVLLCRDSRQMTQPARVFFEEAEAWAAERDALQK